MASPPRGGPGRTPTPLGLLSVCVREQGETGPLQQIVTEYEALPDKSIEELIQSSDLLKEGWLIRHAIPMEHNTWDMELSGYEQRDCVRLLVVWEKELK